MNRPLGVTIIALLLMVGGVLGIIEALDLMGIGDLFGLDDNTAVGVGILIVAAANLLVGFGFWTLQGWAWTLAVIVLFAYVQNEVRLLFGAMAAHFLARILPALGTFLVAPIAGLALTLLFGGLALWFLYRLQPVVQRQAETARKEELRLQGEKKRQATQVK